MRTMAGSALWRQQDERQSQQNGLDAAANGLARRVRKKATNEQRERERERTTDGGEGVRWARTKTNENQQKHICILSDCIYRIDARHVYGIENLHIIHFVM